MKRRLEYFSELRLQCLVAFTLLACTFVSCAKSDIRQGEKSIVGIWNVVELRIGEGERTELGSSIDSEAIYTEDLELFHFTEDKVTWTFEPGDTLIINNEDWILSSRKENSGFTKVTVFTLAMAQYDFDCVFEDDTKNAEKNAENISLHFETDGIGPFSTIDIKLEKE